MCVLHIQLLVRVWLLAMTPAARMDSVLALPRRPTVSVTQYVSPSATAAKTSMISALVSIMPHCNIAVYTRDTIIAILLGLVKTACESIIIQKL